MAKQINATIDKSLNECLDLIGSCLYNNSLFLNLVKTEAMLFGTHARLSDADFGITFKGRLIKRVFEFKYFGVAFDKHTSWNSHVKYVLFRARKRLGMLGRIRRNLTSECANSKLTAYIRPIMDYCDTMWNCCGVGNSSSLERHQRRAAKIVSKMSNSDRPLDYLKWPSLVNRRESHVNELVKRCMKEHWPQFFKNYFTFNRGSRQMKMLHLPRVRTDLGKNSFYYNGSIIFNRLNFLCFKILFMFTVNVRTSSLYFKINFKYHY